MHVPSVPHDAQGRASMRMHEGRGTMRMLPLVLCNKGIKSPRSFRSCDSRGNTHGQRSMAPTPGIKPVKCSRGGRGIRVHGPGPPYPTKIKGSYSSSRSMPFMQDRTGHVYKSVRAPWSIGTMHVSSICQCTRERTGMHVLTRPFAYSDKYRTRIVSECTQGRVSICMLTRPLVC